MMAAFGLGGILVPSWQPWCGTPRRPRGPPPGHPDRSRDPGQRARPGIGLALAGLVVTGCLSIWFIARANTLVQLHSDPAMRDG